MAGGVEERVATVFETVDKATAPARRMAKEFKAVADKAERAQKAVARAGGAGAGKAGKGLGEFSGEQIKAFREEQRLDRVRQGMAREAAEKHQIAGRAVLTSAQLLGLSMKGTAGKIVSMGATVSSLGFEMSQLGGKWGQLGAKLGKAGGALSALAVGFEIGTALDNLGKTLEFAERSLSDVIAGLPVPSNVKAQNLKYAKAQGYKTIADMAAGKAAQIATATQLRVDEAAKKYAADLAATPIGATMQQQNNYNAALFKAAKAIHQQSGGSFEAALTAAKKASEEGLNSQNVLLKQRQEEEINLMSAVHRQAGLIGSLPTGATKEAQIAYANELREAGMMIIKSSGLASSTLEQVVAMLEKEAQQTLGATVATLRERSQKQIEVDTSIDQAAKNLRKLGGGRTEQAKKRYDDALWREATKIAGDRFGTDKASAEVERIYGELKSKTKRDVSKTNFDFRNSRFDIKQEFAEGFDPDRVAAAFANDLASLGERKTQSGFAPLLAVR
jgi:hypothetical protein